MLRRGRFEREMDVTASEYTSSMRADVRLFSPVVQINMAHTIMLAERKIISLEDASSILHALYNLHQRGIKSLDFGPELEDIHMSVEKFVIAATSDKVGGKLHTAKSRNDQVAAAIRMALRSEILEVQTALLNLVGNLIALAEKNVNTIMPGYTHLQIAQPTTFAHCLAAYAWTFLHDVERLMRAYEQTNSCPMGACALAGTSFQIDRLRVARLLGFNRVVENTMEAISARDFALQTMSALAILMGNLSRLAEELVLWSSAEFDMIAMPDEFSSTSSIMPQKKNPVVPEIARAKAGRVGGDLIAGLVIIKSLPQSYSLDLQEFTSSLWDAVDQTKSSVIVISKVIGAIKPKVGNMRRRAEESFAIATDLADALVQGAGIAFRDAHSVVGRMVAKAVAAGKSPKDLSFDDLQSAGREVLNTDIQLSELKFRKALNVDECVESRALPGGPAPRAMRTQIDGLRAKIKGYEKLIRNEKRSITKDETKLLRQARKFR